MDEDLLTKAGEIIEKNTMHQGCTGMPYCVMALLDQDGCPTASTITPSKADGLRWISFCTGINSNKANRIRKCNRASVCFCDEEYNITLQGTVEVVSDAALKKEMWYSGLSNHYMGPEDPRYCVLLFTTERYNLLINYKQASGTLHRS